MAIVQASLAKGMYKKAFEQMLAGADAKLQGKPIKAAAASAV